MREGDDLGPESKERSKVTLNARQFFEPAFRRTYSTGPPTQPYLNVACCLALGLKCLFGFCAEHERNFHTVPRLWSIRRRWLRSCMQTFAKKCRNFEQNRPNMDRYNSCLCDQSGCSVCMTHSGRDYSELFRDIHCGRDGLMPFCTLRRIHWRRCRSFLIHIPIFPILRRALKCTIDP